MKGDATADSARGDATAPETASGGVTPPSAGAVALGTRMGRYELLSLVGAGGMGAVFAARDPELDRTVAVKILHKAHDTGSVIGELRLRREGQTMARLAHPNVIRVYDVGVAGGNVFVAMEYIAGGTLQQWIDRAPRTPDEIIATFVHAGRGLAAAHDAGLVHRDFKPSNVLVGDDGRVLVTDFGLARPSSDSSVTSADPQTPPTPLSTSSPSGSSLSTITRAGDTVGTPAFMAPEQHAGGHVDARADQFSFCVALWRALYGAAPFRGRSGAELTESMERDTPAAPSTAGKIPPRARDALLRGLRTAPSARFPSMRALLDVLAPPPRPRRALYAAGAALAIAAGGAGAYLAFGRTDARADCTSMADRFAGVWDADAARAVHAVFATTGVSYAEATYREVARQLDAHRRAWDAMRLDSCLATRARREQSDAMMDVRAACLDHRLAELGAFVGELRHADAAVVRGAAEQAAVIGDVSACADVDVLARRAPLPADRARKDAIAALERDLATAHAKSAAGHDRQVADGGDALIARARAAAYPPDLADALIVVAHADSELDKAADADTLLDEAVLAAEAGGDDDLRFDAETALVTIDGYLLERDRDGRDHAERAQALLTRLGDDPRRAAKLAVTRAGADWWNGRYADARKGAQHAVELLMRIDPEGVDVSRALHLRAIVEQDMGDDQASVASEEKARAIGELALGPDHPAVAQIYETMGGSLRNLGKLDEAQRALERGLAILESAKGDDSEAVGAAEMNLGLLYDDQKAYDKAIETLQRAVSTTEKAMGADHSRVADTLESLAEALSNAGRGPEAVAAFERAIAIHRARLGADAPQTASSVRHLGEYYLNVGDATRARPLFAEAVRALEASQGKESAMLAQPLADLGDADVALKERARANAEYTRARGLVGDDPHNDGLRARLTRALAGAPPPAPPQPQQ